MSGGASETVWEKLRRWFWNGPSGADGPDGTLGWALGMTLHWRMLLFSAILYGSAVLSIFAGNYVGNGVLGAFAGWIIGLYAGGWMLRASPKYNVTKNY